MPAHKPDFPGGVFRGLCTRVIDGDTIVVEADLGFYVTRQLKIRVADIDAPEPRSPFQAERELAKEATEFVEGACLNRWVLLEARRGRSFDRWVADIYVYVEENGAYHSLAEAMVEAGHAKMV